MPRNLNQQPQNIQNRFLAQCLIVVEWEQEEWIVWILVASNAFLISSLYIELGKWQNVEQVFHVESMQIKNGFTNYSNFHSHS